MTFREKGTRDPKFPRAIPFWSVDTVEEAKTIILLFCKLQYDNNRYVYPQFGGEVDDIFNLPEKLGLSHE